MHKTVYYDIRRSKDTHTKPHHNSHKSTWRHDGVLAFCKPGTPCSDSAWLRLVEKTTSYAIAADLYAVA